MADLLECLIQIKALREALRLAEAAEGAASLSAGGQAGTDHLPVWCRLCDAERRYATAIGANSARAASPGGGDADGPAAFAALRRASLDALDSCTAARLGAPVDWPGRPSTTVADIVAIMLAHDTEMLGGLRRSSPCGYARTPPALSEPG
jgi:hypothetical protein